MLLNSTSKSFNFIFKVVLKYGCDVFGVGKTAKMLKNLFRLYGTKFKLFS